MKYRDARLLKEGDSVIRKDNQVALVVESIEAYGQFKTVKINCVDGKVKVSIFNYEVL